VAWRWFDESTAEFHTDDINSRRDVPVGMPSHVLVPYDGSMLAEQALRYVCSEFPTSEVTVLFVVDRGTDETAAAGWGDHPSEWDQWLEERREHAEELFEGATTIADEYDVTVETGVGVGPLVDTIVGATDEYGADLIVVGAHGRPSLEARIFGSVASGLVRRSPVPVTTIRKPVT
jgi:nucleotide-binding universal stress UspA family protein